MKLVAEAGVGTVAAGVAKAHADVVLISGHDGGTGASPLTSIRHAGVPWELGLAETQQMLVLNDLRRRILVQTDGKLQTGRDVAIAALLGAEEFGFSTAPLVAMGCIMMRKCHLNTCPVGIATQDPVLRAAISGHAGTRHQLFLLRRRAGAAVDGEARLPAHGGHDRPRGPHRDAGGGGALEGARAGFFAAPLQSETPARVERRCVIAQDHGLDRRFRSKLIRLASRDRERRPVEARAADAQCAIAAWARCFRARSRGGMDRRVCPPDSIRFNFTGSAGQSFGAFLARGVTLELEGDSNDYTGKGLSGGKLIVYPPRGSRFAPDENILIGNVALYGATSGEAFFNGRAGERFAVRNSGATAVVEGVGDHGCEYMTKGLVIVLGETGKNFAAGMTGGIAYVLDRTRRISRDALQSRECRSETLDRRRLEALRFWIARHAEETGSPLANRILENWDVALRTFVKVFPREYKRVLGLEFYEPVTRWRRMGKAWMKHGQNMDKTWVKHG